MSKRKAEDVPDGPKRLKSDNEVPKAQNSSIASMVKPAVPIAKNAFAAMGAAAKEMVLPYYYYESGPLRTGTDKLALFDMDGTLITPKDRSRKFPAGPKDFRLWNNDVISKLQQLYDEGYAIYIVSNQNVKGKNLANVKEKVSKWLPLQITTPYTFIAALNKDVYRKPDLGMWELIREKNGDVKLDMAGCFFVGDAAGRAKDHSDCDKMFAKNACLPFHLPEDYFGDYIPSSQLRSTGQA